MSIYEITMLLCFGCAWPFSVYKSYTSRTTKGKSFIFLLVVFLGYVAGILNKYLVRYDQVVYFYYVNAVLVLADLGLYLRNAYLERRA